MKRDTAIEAIRQNAAELRRRGVDALHLFGSTARDEAEPDSDVDIFIDRNPTAEYGIYDLWELQTYLETVLKERVDLMKRSDLNSVIRSEVIDEAIRVL